MLIGFEALRDLRLAEIEIETPLETTAGARLGDDIVVIAILRAGLGMVEGFLALMPEARVGHLGMYRDEEKLSPVGYYESIPDHGPEAEIVLVDPMLATGGSAASALRLLRSAAPSGCASSAWSPRPRGSRRSAPSTPRCRSSAPRSTAQLDERGYIRPGPRRRRRPPLRHRLKEAPHGAEVRLVLLGVGHVTAALEDQELGAVDPGGDRLAGRDHAGAVVAPGRARARAA